MLNRKQLRGLGTGDSPDFAGVQVSGTTGGILSKCYEATSGALSGATGSIAVNVPLGSLIKGVQLRVNTDITSDGVVKTWSADYVNVPTTAIGAGYNFAKNTKVSSIHPAYEVSTGTVTITITPGSGNFTAGAITAIVYCDVMVTMGDA